MLQAYQSSRTEWLADQLGSHIFGKRDPFEIPWVVVPNQAVKEYLNYHFASRFGIATGIHFVFLEEALGELAGKKGAFPNPLELALKIGKVLEGGDFGPLSTYIKQGKNRIVSLSNACADPLLHWGVYGAGTCGGPVWQKALVEAVYKGWETPFQLLHQQRPLAMPPSLHLFGFYHLPPLYFRYLYGGSYPTFLYLFSPCAQFWTDTVSEKGAVRLGITQETCPLLADWGKLGRRLLKMVEESDVEVIEHYPIVAQIQEHEDHLAGELTFEEGELTTLTALQADLLLMRAAPLKLEDDSVTLHAAPSHLREVEICAEEILRRGGSSSDFLVMAPDITPYAPYIEAVFEREKIPYRILDIQRPERESLNGALARLLALGESRWEASLLLKIFAHPLFVGLSAGDLALIEKWVVEGGIRWGIDPLHWEKILGLEHEGGASWEVGFGRLLTALTCLKEEACFTIEISEAETLGRLITLFRRLKVSLAELEGPARSLEEWAVYWTDLSVEFFGKVPSFPWRGHLLKGETFPFSHVKPHLEREWGKCHSSVHTSNLEGALFCSFLPMRMRPASHLFLMGMDEETFPRRRSTPPFDLVQGTESIPTPGELDRSLLLDAIHGASKSLTISYCNLSSEDGLAQGPSPLVDDLISYLGKEALIHPGVGHAEPTLRSQIQHKRALCRKVERRPWPPLPLPIGTLKIDIRDLRLSASDPLRLHCREVGVDLGQRVLKGEDEEPFHLDSLDQALATWSAAGHPRAFSPSLPAGPFGELFAQKIAEGGALLKGEVERRSQGDLKTLHLDDLAPIIVSETLKVQLVGEVGPVSQGGLLVFSKGAKGGALIRNFPLFLAFVCLVEQEKLECDPSLHFVREGKSFNAPRDPLSLLTRYVRYHIRCLTHPSPLHADLIANLIQGKGDVSVAEGAHWVWRDEQSLAHALSEWQAEVGNVFGTVQEWWS